jgi:hypothetical protein
MLYSLVMQVLLPMTNEDRTHAVIGNQSKYGDKCDEIFCDSSAAVAALPHR